MPNRKPAAREIPSTLPDTMFLSDFSFVLFWLLLPGNFVLFTLVSVGIAVPSGSLLLSSIFAELV